MTIITYVLMVIACVNILGCQDQIGARFGEDSVGSDQESNHSHNTGEEVNGENSSTTFLEDERGEDAEVIEPREQAGEWANKEHFTFLPTPLVGGDHLDRDSSADLCWIAWRSDTIALVRLHRIVEEVNKCEGKGEPKNTRGYTVFEAERLLHLGGEPLPIYFSLRKMSGTQAVAPNKDYIIGIREYEEGFYSASGALEVVEYDSMKESPRVAVSGKKEVLTAQAEAYTGKMRSEYCNDIVTREAFRRAYFDLEGNVCE